MRRLDRENFGGPLTQGLLFKALRNPKEDWLEHTVEPNEEYDLYKIAYRVYGTTEAWWIIAICARKDNPMERLLAGTTFKIPPLAWVREKLKQPGKTITD